MMTPAKQQSLIEAARVLLSAVLVSKTEATPARVLNAAAELQRTLNAVVPQ